MNNFFSCGQPEYLVSNHCHASICLYISVNKTKNLAAACLEESKRQKCIGRESNPGLADISDPKILNGNGQFYH